MRIQHNIMAMSAYRNYTNNVSAMKKNLEKLSSGYKINRAGDDAAGLAISEKMRAQITGLETAQKNAKDGISLVQTAEGALTEVHDMLNRMVELATQSANGTYDNTTDRWQMQKEVDQLRAEIDRIADSSNFNGINLLDGKLGLNDKAFSIDTAAAVEASDGTIDISALVAKEADGSPKVHLETSAVTAKTPSAVIDLGNLQVEGVTAGDTVSIAINVAGQALTLTATGGTSYTAGDFAADLVAKLGALSSTDGSAGGDKKAIALGGALYKITDAGSTVTLTYAGMATSAGGYTMSTTFDGTSTQAEAMNNALGFDVTVGKATLGTQKGDVIHKATNVEHAVAKVDAGLAGIDIKLSKDMLVQGGTLEIDGTKFVFQTDAATVPTGGTAIDISSAKTDEEKMHMAADLLSKQTVTGKDNRQWKIGVNGDGTTIHIDQTVASAPGKELKKYDDLVGVIKASAPATAAKNVGTKITVNNAEVKEGDTLKVDDKVYVFADKASTKIPDGAIQVHIKKGQGSAFKNLAAALGVTAAPDYDENNNTITVRAASKDDAAPVVLGRGLTLQIGDTADDFNQLNVAVRDMHCKFLGIDSSVMSIADQDSAAKATDMLKAAINTVSDVRGTLGATQNRLDHTINNLSVMTENIQDAESTIRDVDVAEEMMAYTKNNILIQSAQAMLAQANQVPQGVLQLLQ